MALVAATTASSRSVRGIRIARVGIGAVIRRASLLQARHGDEDHPLGGLTRSSGGLGDGYLGLSLDCGDDIRGEGSAIHLLVRLVRIQSHLLQVLVVCIIGVVDRIVVVAARGRSWWWRCAAAGMLREPGELTADMIGVDATTSCVCFFEPLSRIGVEHEQPRGIPERTTVGQCELYSVARAGLQRTPVGC